jgi:hypothetical protein
MSDEKRKTQEVKDEELDKVSGGRAEHMDPMGGRKIDEAGERLDSTHRQDHGVRNEFDHIK